MLNTLHGAPAPLAVPSPAPVRSEEDAWNDLLLNNGSVMFYWSEGNAIEIGYDMTQSWN